MTEYIYLSLDVGVIIYQSQECINQMRIMISNVNIVTQMTSVMNSIIYLFAHVFMKIELNSLENTIETFQVCINLKNCYVLQT